MRNIYQFIKTIFLPAILSFMQYGCAEMVSNVDIPPVDAKLVVNSYISPEDSMIKGRVS